MPDFRRALTLAALFVFAGSQPAAAQLDALRNQAMDRFTANDAHGAISPLSQGLAIAEGRGQQEAIGDFAQNLGLAYDNDNQHDLAIRYYEQAIGVYQNIGHKADLAQTLEYLGIVYKNKGQNAKALDLLTRGLSMARELGNKSLEGRMLGNLGNVYSETSRNAEALDYHTRALSLQTSLGEKLGVALDLQAISADHQAMGDYAKAMDYATRALVAAKEAADKLTEAGIYVNTGNIYLETGDFPKAIESYQRSNAMMRELGEKRDLATGLTNLGIVYRNQTDLPKALELYNQALTLTRETGDKSQEGATTGNLGVVYMDMGDFPKALEMHERSMNLAKETGRKSGEGAAVGNMAIIYELLGDFNKALETAQQSYKLSEEATDKPALVSSLNHVGRIYQEMGDYAKALEFHGRALALSKTIGVPSSDIEASLGAAYLAQGDLAKASELAARAKNDVLSARVAFAKGQFAPAKELFAKAAAQGRGKRIADDVVSANIGLCLTLEKLKDMAGARSACEKAIAAIERQRDLLPQAARGRFLTASVAGFPRIEAYEARTRAASDAADGFFWAESAKARAFIEEVAVRLSSSKAALPPAQAAQEAEANARVAASYKQMNSAFEKNNAPRLLELDKELASALAAREAFVAGLRKSAPAYAAIQYPQPIKAREVALNASEMLVEYAVTNTKTIIFAVGADKKAFSYTAEITRADLRKLVEAFRKPFENPLNAQGKFAGSYDAAAGTKLYNLLLKPVALAAKGKKLILVPDEYLGLLPFEALTARAAPLRYAVDEHDIAYAQSATALTQARTAGKGDSAAVGLLVVADPIFDKADERLKGSGLAAYVAKDFVTMGVAATRRGTGFDRLEETGVLAETLTTAAGSGGLALTGKDATKARVMSEDLGRYRHMVFATHGILDGDVPYIGEPALVLTQVGAEPGDDGYLKMSEIMGLNLHCDVVALTACKTGLGREVGGEGVLGLGRAFQYAGAKNVLMSLWSVSEKSTTALTAAFFKSLKEGKTPREALKTARAELRHGAYAHPFFWAPFVLIGG